MARRITLGAVALCLAMLAPPVLAQQPAALMSGDQWLGMYESGPARVVCRARVFFGLGVGYGEVSDGC